MEKSYVPRKQKRWNLQYAVLFSISVAIFLLSLVPAYEAAKAKLSSALKASEKIETGFHQMKTKGKHAYKKHVYMYRQYRDNIAYVLHEPKTNTLLAIDPGDFMTSRDYIEEIENKTGAQLGYIFATHKHYDHSDGIYQLDDDRNLTVVGGKLQPGNVPRLSQKMFDLQTMAIGDFHVQCIDTPGHSLDSTSWLVRHVGAGSKDPPMLFCGDTLQHGGVATAVDKEIKGPKKELLYKSVRRLMMLPKETQIFYGRERAAKNFRFAKKVEPDNKEVDKRLAKAEKLAETREIQAGQTLGEEFLYNPFMRSIGVKEDYYRAYTGEKFPERIFNELRKRRETFERITLSDLERKPNPEN